MPYWAQQYKLKTINSIHFRRSLLSCLSVFDTKVLLKVTTSFGSKNSCQVLFFFFFLVLFVYLRIILLATWGDASHAVTTPVSGSCFHCVTKAQCGSTTDMASSPGSWIIWQAQYPGSHCFFEYKVQRLLQPDWSSSKKMTSSWHREQGNVTNPHTYSHILTLKLKECLCVKEERQRTWKKGSRKVINKRERWWKMDIK